MATLKRSRPGQRMELDQAKYADFLFSECLSNRIDEPPIVLGAITAEEVLSNPRQTHVDCLTILTSRLQTIRPSASKPSNIAFSESSSLKTAWLGQRDRWRSSAEVEPRAVITWLPGEIGDGESQKSHGEACASATTGNGSA